MLGAKPGETTHPQNPGQDAKNLFFSGFSILVISSIDSIAPQKAMIAIENHHLSGEVLSKWMSFHRHVSLPGYIIWVHLVILTYPNMTLLKCKGQLLEYEGSNELSWPIWNSLLLKWEARFVEQRCFSVDRAHLCETVGPMKTLKAFLPLIHVIVKVFLGVVPNPLRVCVCGLCWPKAFQGKKLRAHPRFSFFSAHPRRGFPERIWSKKTETPLPTTWWFHFFCFYMDP